MVHSRNMTESKGSDDKGQGQLNRPGKLELKKTVESGQVRQNFSHGRSKMVRVEVRKKRTYAPDARGRMAKEGDGGATAPSRTEGAMRERVAVGLTSAEKASRAKALQEAIRADEAQLAADEAAEQLQAAVAAAEPAEPELPAAPPAE